MATNQTNTQAQTEERKFARPARTFSIADLTPEEMEGVPTAEHKDAPDDLGAFIMGMLDHHIGGNAKAIVEANKKPEGFFATAGSMFMDGVSATAGAVVNGATAVANAAHDAAHWVGIADERVEIKPLVIYPGFEDMAKRQQELTARLLKKQGEYDEGVEADRKAGLKPEPKEEAKGEDSKSDTAATSAGSAGAASAVQATPAGGAPSAAVAATPNGLTDEQFAVIRGIVAELVPLIKPVLLEGKDIEAAMQAIPELEQLKFQQRLVEAGLSAKDDPARGALVQGTLIMEATKAVMNDPDVSAYATRMAIDAATLEMQEAQPVPQQPQQPHHPVAQAHVVEVQPDALSAETQPNESQAVHARFLRIFNSIEKSLPWADSYINKDGYFNPAVENEMLNRSLKEGDMAKTIDPNNRAVVFIGTRQGVAVVFTRYPMDGDNIAVVCNTSKLLRASGLLKAGATPGPLSQEGLDEFFGENDDFNIGNRELDTVRKNGQKPRR